MIAPAQDAAERERRTATRTHRLAQLPVAKTMAAVQCSATATGPPAIQQPPPAMLPSHLHCNRPTCNRPKHVHRENKGRRAQHAHRGNRRAKQPVGIAIHYACEASSVGVESALLGKASQGCLEERHCTMHSCLVACGGGCIPQCQPAPSAQRSPEVLPSQ